MQVGDTVVDIRSVGTIVGVSKAGNPVVEWEQGTIDYRDFEEVTPELLVLVNMPKPNEELDPSKDTE